MRVRTRIYEVSGLDDLGDVHLYRTNDRERAQEVQRQMTEDLEDVLLIEQP